MACSLLTYEGGSIMGIWSEFAEEGLMSIKKTKPQKSRDAKRYVLTSRARNKQLGLIKKSSKKSMRQYNKQITDIRYMDSHYA